MIDKATIQAELDDSARQRIQAKLDMADAQELAQIGQQKLADASRRFIAHDAVVQALTILLAKDKPNEAPVPTPEP